MFLRLFKGSQPIFIIIIPLLGVLLWLRSIIDPFVIPDPQAAMPFYLFADKWVNANLLVSKFTALGFLIVTSLLLARINTKFLLIPSRTYLPAVVFLIIASAYPHLQYFHPVIPSVLILLLAVYRMLDAYKKPGLSYNFFDAAILISLSSLFYAKMIVFLLMVWLGLIYLRQFNWREWVMSLIGALLPYLFCISWEYLYGRDPAGIFNLLKMNFVRQSSTKYLEYPYYLFIGTLILLILAASMKMIALNWSLKIIVRQFSKLFLWMFIITAVMSVFFLGSATLLTIAAVPAAYLISFYFFNMRSEVAGEMIFFFFLAAFVAVQVLVR